MLDHAPRLGQVQEHAVEALFGDALVHVADLHVVPVEGTFAEEGGHVGHRPLGEIVPHLVADDVGTSP